MGFLFTSESVSEGHPDKVSDQISDAILDEFLRHDPNSKVACETLCTTGLVVVAGEVRSSAYVDIQHVTRRVINRIGYTKSEYQFDGNSCGVLSAIHEQSPDINQGVVREAEEEQGAGDQGIMFGYACNETREYMPATLILSHVILKELAVIRREGQVMTYLRPDAKSQVTIEYDEQTHRPLRVHTIVVSTQHDDFIPTSKGVTEKMAEKRMQEKIREDVRTILIPRVKARLERAGDQLAELIGDDYILHVNPTGKFVIGGPHGDTGLTGRKIIVDTYGGYAAHGGGAFSGKDPTKVDRSAAYMARHVAKNIVAACKVICEQYGGEVPGNWDALVKLPGVGRKTANVVWANAFGGDAIAVDTHVFRVSNRLGLADANNVEKTELQLQQAIPKSDWSKAHHWLIFHGRRVCSARAPKCDQCTLKDLCKDYQSRS